MKVVSEMAPTLPKLKSSYKRILTVFIALVVGAGSLTITSHQVSASDSRSAVNALSLIKAEFSAGKISLDEMVIFQVTAIRKPGELPQRFLIQQGLSVQDLRSATMFLKEIRAVWSELSPETQRSVTEALARKNTAFTFDSPGGFFKLHYDTVGTHAVSSADVDSDGTPDFVGRCAAYCDTSYLKLLSLGYLVPPPDGALGGDSKYDVYFENMGFYGYAVPEGSGPNPWNDAYSYLVLNNNFFGFPPNNDPEGNVLGAAKVTVAHEYHHAVQFAYDFGEPSWFMELDATYMEDIVFDLTDDNYNYLGSFMSAPSTSLTENSGHAYSCFIWGLYLAQNFDTSLMRAAWDGARYASAFNTLSDTLFARYGWTQDSAFADFVTWNFATFTRDDNLHHAEAVNYPLISIGRTHSTYPVVIQNSPSNPAGYGSNYIQFFPGGQTGTLTISFDGNNDRDWAAYVIKSTSVNSHQIVKIELDTATWASTVFVSEFENYYSVTLIGINISEFSSGRNFTYSADVIQPHGVSSSLLVSDTIIYSGDLREFSYQVFNTSAIDDVYRIMYWDDLGWINADTISRAIQAGTDTIFAIDVQPPQGTPLSITSQVHFRAESVDDTTANDEQSVAVQTVLHKGDPNFDGSINIIDLTYLVDYFFRGGTAPLPVLEAGDFNCDASTNILDLTGSVDYSFRGGSLPPCNPY